MTCWQFEHNVSCVGEPNEMLFVYV